MKAAARVFGYVRVSTAEQANAGLSLETQQQQITGYCMIKGWTVAEFFVEAGVSGSVPLADRPEGKRLLATLQPGDTVITAKLDRAFRSAADALGTLEQLKDDGIGLHMIDLGGDVTGNGISKLVFTILSAVAENERDRIRERVREAKRHRVAQRLFNGGKRPFGFDIVGKDKDRRLVPNANEQAALERARALRAEGKSYRDIADAWISEFGMRKFDAKSILRIIERKRHLILVDDGAGVALEA
jgi:putative DNA-invertase from lambdoid prophage Rac